MLPSDFLDEYANSEQEVGEEIAPKLLSARHTLLDPLALYPEYGLQEGSLGLHRPGVKLGLLLFFFPKVIAYIPPLKPDEFSPRFGLDLDSFLALADPALGENRLVYPVINHPRHYNDPEVQAFLEPLLQMRPPTWERWHSALAVTGGDRWFDVADRHLPTGSLLSNESMLAKWQDRHSVRTTEEARREITQQARNRFVDLCLIGLKDEAVRICGQKTSSPIGWFGELDYISEVLAYSNIMGAGGTFNYVTRNSKAYIDVLRRLQSSPITKQILDADLLQVLLEGFQFHKVPRVIWVDYLLEYHKSEEAKKVRASYQRLMRIARRTSGKVTVDEMLAELTVVLGAIRQYCENSESNPKFKGKLKKERETVYSVLCAVGSILAGIHGLVNPQVPGLAFVEGVGFTVLSFLPPEDENGLQKRFIKNNYQEINRMMEMSEDEILVLFKDASALAEYRKRNVQRLVEKGFVENPSGPALAAPLQHLWIPVTD